MTAVDVGDRRYEYVPDDREETLALVEKLDDLAMRVRLRPRTLVRESELAVPNRVRNPLDIRPLELVLDGPAKVASGL